MVAWFWFVAISALRNFKISYTLFFQLKWTTVNAKTTVYQSHKVNLDKTYEIVWNGQAIKDCGVGFYTKGEGLYASDHFKICVDLIDWDMSDCSSQMYLEYNGVKVQMISLESIWSFLFSPLINSIY